MALPHLGIFLFVRGRNSCLYSSVVRGGVTPQDAGCGGDFQNKFKRFWSLISTAGSHLQTQTFTLFIHPPSCWFFFLFQSCFTLNKRRVSLLHCRYKSSQKEVNWSKLKKPIYLSNKGSKFSDWSATWAGYLISKVSLP